MVANLPKQYAWLAAVAELPKTIQQGVALLGTVETPGTGNNPVIMAWVRELGISWLPEVYTSDAVPWCGLAAGIVAKRAGKAIFPNLLQALAWAAWGVGVAKAAASLGDCLIFVRKGGGHVGWYVGEDSTHYHVLGGNQSDCYSIARLPKSMLYAVRRPVYSKQPASVRPYKLAGTGTVAKSLA